MMSHRHGWLAGCALLLWSTQAPSVETADLEVDVFTPSGGNPERLVFPRDRLLERREGWVKLNFMVDPEGRPYEVMVVDSIGDRRFEQAAVKAIEKSTFEPARLNGAPVDAGRTFYMTFQIDRCANTARHRFIGNYKRLRRAIEKNDRDLADRMLQGLDAQNLYEYAYASLARYLYAARWETPAEQMEALRRATFHERDIRYLPDDDLRGALLALLNLEFRSHLFSDALETAKQLESLHLSPEAAAHVRQVRDDIQKLRNDDRYFSVRGSIGERSHAAHSLLKRRFRIDLDEGEVTELKLRCERSYLVFGFQPDIEYTVDPAVGDCTLELVGAPGTLFVLTER